jgi:LEA14-like dessication related protein
MNTKSIVLGLTIIIMASSCISYREVQLTDVELKGVVTDNDKYRVAFDLEIDNPNTYAITLSKPRLHVFVAGQEVKDWTCVQKLKIKKQAKNSYPFYIEVSGKEVTQLLPRLFLNPSIKVDGSIRVGTMLLRKKIPISIEEKIY